MSALITHRVSVRSWTLANRRRRGLHPGGRQAVGVWGHRGASHVGHGGRIVVGSSMATMPSMHAMVVPVLSWTRAHPRRPVLLHTNSHQFKTLFYTNGRMESCVLPTNLWWLVIVGS